MNTIPDDRISRRTLIGDEHHTPVLRPGRVNLRRVHPPEQPTSPATRRQIPSISGSDINFTRTYRALSPTDIQVYEYVTERIDPVYASVQRGETAPDPARMVGNLSAISWHMSAECGNNMHCSFTMFEDRMNPQEQYPIGREFQWLMIGATDNGPRWVGGFRDVSAIGYSSSYSVDDIVLEFEVEMMFDSLIPWRRVNNG